MMMMFSSLFSAGISRRGFLSVSAVNQGFCFSPCPGLLLRLLQKYGFVVRQAHHERKKHTNIKHRLVTLSLPKGDFWDFCKSLYCQVNSYNAGIQVTILYPNPILISK
jgi:hypothetical protein